MPSNLCPVHGPALNLSCPDCIRVMNREALRRIKKQDTKEKHDEKKRDG